MFHHYAAIRGIPFSATTCGWDRPNRRWHRLFCLNDSAASFSPENMKYPLTYTIDFFATSSLVIWGLFFLSHNDKIPPFSESLIWDIKFLSRNEFKRRVDELKRLSHAIFISLRIEIFFYIHVGTLQKTQVINLITKSDQKKSSSDEVFIWKRPKVDN